MYLKKIIFFSILFFSVNTSFSAEYTASYKFYGYIRNDFYFNSRQNEQSLDGLFNILPKPIELNSASEDKNAVPNAEMLSIATRLGIDFTGTPIMGAKSTAKIECDFGGISASYFLIRLRQAYLKLNWSKTELLVGQTWHPMFGNVLPTMLAMNAGAPFQPFNRSPQLRIKQNLSTSISATGAAIYQMQNLSQGPNGASATYMKNALIPNIFMGLESKSKKWILGLGVDTKTLKPKKSTITSISAVAYAQYVNKKFQLKSKTVFGENLTDLLMIGGYGIDGLNASGDSTYTNFKNVSYWINAVYGTIWQVGIFAGITQNLGTNKNLLADKNGKYTAYGCGFYQKSQLLNDRTYRIAPHLIYNLPNFRLGFEYEFTNTDYGNIKSDGRITNSYWVNNHRAVASISYIF